MNLTVMRILLRAILTSTLMVTSSMAALTVIADLGGQSTAPLFDAINNETNEFTPPETLSVPPPSAPVSPATLGDMLPISTPEMTPGVVQHRPMTLVGITPVFLIGDDALSRQWLLQRYDMLKRLQATGLVVNVMTAPALRDLQMLAPGVMLLPASGSDIARRLQLSHYPVLITDTGLQQ